MAVLTAKNLSVDLEKKPILTRLDLGLVEGEVLSIIGPNGSGKSTLLKTFSRNLRPQEGTVLLDGEDIQNFNPAEIARRMAVLQQSSRAPEDLTVGDLVEFGRFPYRQWWKSPEREDRLIVEEALDQTGMGEFIHRRVSTLSGGEQQRAWIAMALAQKPQLLLLDEPTTYLDICHQLEILDLIHRLNRELGLTTVMVLHDMNHAARYSDRVAVMEKGRIYGVGIPEEMITPTMLQEVFRVEAQVWRDENGKPVFLARNRVGAAGIS